MNIAASGLVTGFTLSATSGDEREAVWDIFYSIRGLLVGDKDYINRFLRQDLERYGNDLLSRGRSKTQEYGLKSWAWLLQVKQQLIAAVNRQLAEHLI